MSERRDNPASRPPQRGPKRVAAAKPDGYQLVLMHIGISTSVPLYRNLGYNPVTDTPIDRPSARGKKNPPG